MGVSCRIAFTLVGANGNSITDNRAERVSFPPGDVTYQRQRQQRRRRQNHHLNKHFLLHMFIITFECNLN